MKTVKILAIGNSFSRDATRYLHQVARAAGIDTKIVDLYIPGCPLEHHWSNIELNKSSYAYGINGTITEITTSIDEALDEEQWDYITLQQASHDSGWLCSYEPFLGLLLEHIRGKVPNAKIYLHETWAYEVDSPHPKFIRYNRNQQEMHERLHACYFDMAEKYGLGIIPCGDVLQAVRQIPEFHVPTGGLSLCRDKFHMSFDYGRFLLACVWAKVLLHVHVKENTYVPQSYAISEKLDPHLLQIIREAVDGYFD